MNLFERICKFILSIILVTFILYCMLSITLNLKVLQNINENLIQINNSIIEQNRILGFNPEENNIIEEK